MTSHSQLPAMKAIRLEWDKARRSRVVVVALVALVVGTGALAFLYAWISSAVSKETPASIPEILAFCVVKASLAPAAASLLGAWLGGMEHRGRIWALTLLRLPRRVQVLNAKLTILGTLAAVGALSAMAVTSVAITLFLGTNVLVTDIHATVWLMVSHVLVTVSWGVAGCCLGVAMRSALGAMGVLVAISVVIEPAIQSIATSAGGWISTASALLPLAVTTSVQMPISDEPFVLFAANVSTLPAPVSAFALLGYVALAVVASHLRFARQSV